MTRRIIGAVVLLVLIGAGFGLYYLFSNLEAIVADAIESGGSEATGTDVGVSGVKLELREGRASISGLRVASPDGYDVGDAFSLGDITVDVDVGSLREKPVVLDEVRIEAPVVHAEFTKSGGSNLDDLRRHIQESAGSGAAGEGGAKAEAPRIRIRRFVFSEGRIEVDASALGLEPRTVKLPEIDLSDLGGPQGATPEEIARQVLGEVTRRSIDRIARSEVEGLIREQLDESVADKAKGLLDKIGN